jgi:hypothetical protein
MIPDQLDSVTTALPRQTRRNAMRTLGGLLALVPGVAGAKANQSSSARADDGGDGMRRKHHRQGKHHTGGGGSRGCGRTCPRGALTVAPTAQGECRCVPVSPGLRDPDFTCGERVNRNGDACCYCLYTLEGEGFCAINAVCDVLAASSITDCTSSGDCPSGRKCVPVNPNLVENRPAEGVCWPECHTTDGVSPVEPPL